MYDCVITLDREAALFWHRRPNAAALLYFILMTYIVLAVLREVKPMVYYVISAVLFVLSQLAWFLLGRVVCKVSFPDRFP